MTDPDFYIVIVKQWWRGKEYGGSAMVAITDRDCSHIKPELECRMRALDREMNEITPSTLDRTWQCWPEWWGGEPAVVGSTA